MSKNELLQAYRDVIDGWGEDTNYSTPKKVQVSEAYNDCLNAKTNNECITATDHLILGWTVGYRPRAFAHLLYNLENLKFEESRIR